MKRKSIIFYLAVPLLAEWGVSLIVQMLALMFFKNLQSYVMELTFAISMFTIPIVWWIYKKDEREKKCRKTELVPAEWLKLTVLGILSCIVLNVLITSLNLEQLSRGYGEISTVIYESSYLVQILATVVAAPIQEELVYRGLLYGRMREFVPKVPAMLCSSLIFGICHGNLVQLVFAFFIGLILCMVYEKYGEISGSIWVHMIVNLTSLCMTWLLSGV